MGQYYKICNLTKKEVLNAWTFGDGAKLTEFGLSAFGTMSGLAILLANGNGNGGGDIEEDPVTGIVGRWAGDKIVIAGDYGDEGKFITTKDVEGMSDKNGKPLTKNEAILYFVARKKYKDISFDVLFALMADSFTRGEIVGHQSSDEVIDFNKIHLQLAKNQNDLALLVGQLKTAAGKSILERFLKGKKKK
jgi:hypothetical protein